MKSAADDNSRTLHCLHCALAINCWHLLHFAALSFFTARVLRLAPSFRFFFLISFFFMPFLSLRCGMHGKAEKASRDWRAYCTVCTCARTYLRVDMSEGNEFVCLGTRITCFTCRLELLEKFTRSFRVTPACEIERQRCRTRPVY